MSADEDRVKAAYQCAFGASHFSGTLADAEKAIEKEMTNVSGCTGDDLGDYLRLSLSGSTARELGSALTAKAFVFSASHDINGDSCERFEEYVQEAAKLSDEPEKVFSLAENALFSPPSHSLQYKNAYHPSYRLISKYYARALGCAARINKLLKNAKHPAVIALDGPCASGKSTVASLLAYMFDADIITTDDFFLPPEKRSTERLTEPGGNVDYERFEDEVIRGICSGKPFTYRAYSCSSGSYTEKHIDSTKNIIVEGSYSHRKEFRKAYDMTVYSDVSCQEQLRRLEERSPDRLERFKNEWIPLENKYFDFYRIKENADYVIPQSVSEEDI